MGGEMEREVRVGRGDLYTYKTITENNSNNLKKEKLLIICSGLLRSVLRSFPLAFSILEFSHNFSRKLN